MKRSRGMTLLEVIVSIAIMTMVALLIYGAFDSLSRGKKGEEMRTERTRQGRDAMARIVRELSGAFISAHVPTIPSMQTRITAFIGQNNPEFDRVDFASFAHRRIEKDSKDSDQAEIAYFVVRDPNVDGKMDLVRREQAPIDMDPKRGGVVSVLAEDVVGFELRYLDPISGTWIDTWDTTQAAGQGPRLPLEVRVSLSLKGLKNGPPFVFTTKAFFQIQQPLSFGFPK